MNRIHKHNQNGFIVLAALIFITLFSVLAISFASMCNTNVHSAKTHRDISRSLAAAESGLAYAHYLFGEYILNDAVNTSTSTITQDDASNTFHHLHTSFRTAWTSQ